MKSQTDRLGQQVTIGAIVLASFMHGRSHHFMLAKVAGLTPQFANLVALNGVDNYILPRKCRFYNLVVVNKLLPTESKGAQNAAEMAQNG